ncbi:hypothetical protein HMI56_001757 [Coelomomyces lativittatus]|nr:hypothetical protein HMI56_001757 [Coelomomyces lativittatus]
MGSGVTEGEEEAALALFLTDLDFDGKEAASLEGGADCYGSLPVFCLEGGF